VVVEVVVVVSNRNSPHRPSTLDGQKSMYCRHFDNIQREGNANFRYCQHIPRHDYYYKKETTGKEAKNFTHIHVGRITMKVLINELLKSVDSETCNILNFIITYCVINFIIKPIETHTAVQSRSN